MIKNINLHGIVTKYTNKIKFFSLKKENIYNFKISMKPNIIINQLNNKENVYNFNKKFNEYIDNFISYIQKENSNINLDLFFENLRTLTIKEKHKFIFFKKSVKGYYNPNENTICLLKNNYLYSIYHELLHCASKTNVDSSIFIGFFQKSNLNNIGRGINEGYTALLEERYFKNFHRQTSYVIEKYIATLLEEIVGKEKMTSLYFTADLYNLIEELKKYSNKKDIITFIKYLDEINYDNIGTKKLKFGNEKFNFISEFLLNCYSKKLHELYNKDLIDFENLKKKGRDFLMSILITYKTKNKKYIPLAHDKAEEIIENYCNQIFGTQDKKK